MFEWLVPACMKHVKTSTLSVPYSELHIFNSMLTILRAILGVDAEQGGGSGGGAQPGGQQAGGQQGGGQQQQAAAAAAGTGQGTLAATF